MSRHGTVGAPAAAGPPEHHQPAAPAHDSSQPHRTGSAAIDTLRKRLAALGGVAVLTAATAGCQVAQSAQAGAGVPDALDELLSLESVTAQAEFAATPAQVHDYLRRSAAAHGEPEPTAEQARVLSELEVTTVVGVPNGDEDHARLREQSEGEPLDTALAIGFGGEDAVGVKNVDERTYFRVNGPALVRDAYGGSEAEAERAMRMVRDSERLPDSLEAARDAFQANWVEGDPHLFEAYSDALHDGADVPYSGTDRIAAALTDANALLTAGAQWSLVEGLRTAAGGATTLREAGEENGAQLVEVRLPAMDAQRALGPALRVLAEQGERFGLPPLVYEPDDPDAEVAGELSIRNGVLTGVTFDVGQFGGDAEEAGSLPLEVSLRSGAAIPLDEPDDSAELAPEDITVALLYLRVWGEQRDADPDRANVPGPVQP